MTAAYRFDIVTSALSLDLCSAPALQEQGSGATIPAGGIGLPKFNHAYWVLYRDYIGILEEKIESTIWGLWLRGFAKTCGIYWANDKDHSVQVPLVRETTVPDLALNPKLFPCFPQIQVFIILEWQTESVLSRVSGSQARGEGTVWRQCEP